MAENQPNINDIAMKILGGILASLCGFLFYGYIQLSSDFEAYKAEHTSQYEQVRGEVSDLWEHYNEDTKEKELFLKEYYLGRSQ